MALGNKNSVTADSFQPIKTNVFVTDLDHGPTVTQGGIIRPDDNMSATGIRPRWACVWAIGPEVEDIKVGEWVFIEHARWTNSIDIRLPEGNVRVWKVDWPNGVLLAAQDDPRETSLTDLPKVRYPTLAVSNSKSVAPAIIKQRN
jgi:hypothetical protein